MKTPLVARILVGVATRVVGIDLGDRTSVACVYVPGVLVKWFEFPIMADGVRAAFELTVV